MTVLRLHYCDHMRAIVRHRAKWMHVDHGGTLLGVCEAAPPITTVNVNLDKIEKNQFTRWTQRKSNEY